MELEAGQVAVITGSASGLGLGLAHRFASRGLDIVLADIWTGPLEEALTAVASEHGVSTYGVPTDVSDLKQVEALASATLDRFGRVDLIVNDAGVSVFGPPTWDVPDDDWTWVMSVNLYGVVNGIRAFVPHLIAQGSGHVVNIASMAGVSVTTLQAPYIASKFAVAGVSAGLRAELDIVAPNVGVTVAFPGVMITNIFTSDRNRPASLPGKPYELSNDEMAEVGRWADEISGPGMPAAEAAEIIVRAVEAGALHVAPNGKVAAVRALSDSIIGDLEAS